MGQIDRPRFCLPPLQEGMIRIDPLESRGSIVKSVPALSYC